MVRSPTAAKIAGRTFSALTGTPLNCIGKRPGSGMASARQHVSLRMQGAAPHHLAELPRMARMIAREGNNLSAAADERCTASVLNMRLGNIASRCAARPDH